VPSTYGSKRWDSFLDKPYETFDPELYFNTSESSGYRRDLHGEPDLRRQRSFSAKEAAEVAAATRFRLELERREQQHNEYEDEYSEMPTSGHILPLRSTSLAYTAAVTQRISDPFDNPEPLHLRRRKTPEPIVVSTFEQPPEETQSAPLPFVESPKPKNDRGNGGQSSVKSHRRHVTISEGASRNMILLHSPSGTYSECPPPLPTLSPSFSTASGAFPDMPSTPLSLNPPNEDRLRRELELFTLDDGGMSLHSHRYRHQPVPKIDFEVDQDYEQEFHNDRNPSSRKWQQDDDARSIVSVTPSMKKRKSIFAMFQRKSEVDKLLDLYLTDDVPEEVQPAKSKPSLARRMTRSRRKKVPDVPAVPPVPPIVTLQWKPPG
jgi:hypothetical protein